MSERNGVEGNHVLLPEPTEEESIPPRVLTVLAFVLERLVSRNNLLDAGRKKNQQKEEEDDVEEKKKFGKKRLKVFNGARTPSISIGNYIERIYKYTKCSPSCFVVGYVYIDRLVHKHPDSLVVSLNVHRLLVTSLMVASKVLDDEHYNNSFYARVGGVSNVELNKLELELMFMLDFSLVVSSRIFESYCFHLEKEMMWGGSGQRIERAIISSSMDDETEISVDSPPLTVD
ncbi:hypothetical protein GIB67_032018 [Kingdonia uniflora]|uniref:Cyclin n=1 Tax=Kingdonia uniflora TaxID=39325 RepID=A0A7J7MWP6_9MAGN|nr:hypothetical protein GIB67_032018 [Kingdonia uniflora]